jgi:hypothetical protein
MLPASILSALEDLDWTDLNVFSRDVEPLLNEIWKQGSVKEELTNLWAQRAGERNPAVSSVRAISNQNKSNTTLTLELFPSGHSESARNYDSHVAALVITGIISLSYVEGNEAQSVNGKVRKPFLTKHLTAGSSFCVHKGIIHSLFVPQEAVLLSLTETRSNSNESVS